MWKRSRMKGYSSWIYRAFGVLFLLILISGCGGNKSSVKDINQFFIQEGVFMTSEMKLLAQSGEYKQLFGAPAELQEITDQIAQGDYEMPQKVILMKLPSSLITNFAAMLGEDLKLSEEMEERMSYRINGTLFASFINSRYGPDILAATSTLSWGKSYIQPKGWTDNVLLWLQYDGDYSSLVSFNKSGDGVISGTSTFIKTETMDTMEPLKDEFEKYLKESGLDLDITEFSQSQIKAYLEQ